MPLTLCAAVVSSVVVCTRAATITSKSQRFLLFFYSGLIPPPLILACRTHATSWQFLQFGFTLSSQNAPYVPVCDPLLDFCSFSLLFFSAHQTLNMVLSYFSLCPAYVLFDLKKSWHRLCPLFLRTTSCCAFSLQFLFIFFFFSVPAS